MGNQFISFRRTKGERIAAIGGGRPTGSAGFSANPDGFQGYRVCGLLCCDVWVIRYQFGEERRRERRFRRCLGPAAIKLPFGP